MTWLIGCGERETPPPQDMPPQVEQNVVEKTIDEITTELKIQLALLDELKADGLGIDTEISGDKVILTGEVYDPATSVRAGEIVSHVPGVDSVVNEISVAPAPEMGASETSAEELQQKVVDESLELTLRLRLYAAIGTDAQRIEVEVEDGAVILGGWVPSEEEKTEALAAIKEEVGETAVMDEIEVTQPIMGETGE
jgi:osmotically-inducible protein OsmY